MDKMSKDVHVGRTRLIELAHKGDWTSLVEILKGIEKVEDEMSQVDENDQTVLHIAAAHASNNIVNLLAQKSDPNIPGGPNFWLPLHYAASRSGDSVDVVRTLLKLSNKEARLTPDKDGCIPLFLAIKAGNVGIVKELLSELSEPQLQSKTKDDQTVLHIAAAHASNNILNLLPQKTDLNIPVGPKSWLPLHYAASRSGDSVDVVRTLLKLSNKEARLIPDKDGYIPLLLAIKTKNVEIVKELLSELSELQVEVKTKSGYRALHFAAESGHKNIVCMLLNSPGSQDDDTTNNKQCSPLHLAAQNGHTDVVELLLCKSSDQLDWQDQEGRTCLHLASAQGHIATVRSLLCHGAKINQRDKSGYRALHFAAESGHKNIVCMLLNSPGVRDDDTTNNKQCSPLHLAAQNGHTDVVELLLCKSSDQLDWQDQEGRTCLHLASAQGHIATVKSLLCHGAKINQRDKSGRSALHHAAKAGCLEMVSFLVKHGASAAAECQKGCSPLQYAAKDNHLTTVSFLIQHPDKKIDLLDDEEFLVDLMLCGRLNFNHSLYEMVLYSTSPLATAVRLSGGLNSASVKKNIHSVDLHSAALYCETMASELLYLVCTDDKMNVGKVLSAVDRDSSMLDRLIEGKQKNVMSKPEVQKYLTDVWYGKTENGQKELNFSKILLLFFCMQICPLLWLVISLPLKLRCSNIPVVKFITHLVSHIFLLLLFICTIVLPFGSPTEWRIPVWSESLLIIWLGGLLLSEFKKRAEGSGLSWIRVFILIFSGVALLCYILAVALQSMPEHVNGLLFAHNVLMAVAMSLAFIQLLEFLTFHHLFGPWAIIIKDMMKDLFRFAVILLLFHTAFALSFTAICQPPNAQTSAQSNYSVNVSISESNPLHFAVLLFFAVFGLTEEKDIPCSEDSPAKTSGLTQLAFGIYLVVTVVMLLNLLIAMLNNSYERIHDESDKEWKFGRAILIRDMSCKEAPSPFNLITCLYYSAKSSVVKRDQEEGKSSGESDTLISLAPTHGIIANQNNHQDTQIVMPQEEEKKKIEDLTNWTDVLNRFKARRGQKKIDNSDHQ